jgi:hypothetical protein
MAPERNISFPFDLVAITINHLSKACEVWYRNRLCKYVYMFYEILLYVNNYKHY